MEKKVNISLPKGKGAKNVKFKVEDGKLEVTYDLEAKFDPKDGDFLATKEGRVFIYNGRNTVCQYGTYCGIDIYNKIIVLNYFSSCWTGKEGCRFATPEEKSAFIERLEKELHKRWNPETKQFENIRWRAKVDEGYYFINDQLEISRTNDGKYTIDEKRHQAGNYFFNPGAAQKVIVQIKEIFQNSKAE